MRSALALRLLRRTALYVLLGAAFAATCLLLIVQAPGGLT